MKIFLFINSLRAGGAERVMARLADHITSAGHDVTLLTQQPQSSDRFATIAKRTSLDLPGTSTGVWDRLQNNITRLLRLTRLLRRERPDCIVAFLPTASVLSLLAGRLLNIPVVIGERTYPPLAPSTAWQRTLQRWLYPMAAAVVVQTRDTAAWYRETLAIEDTTVIANGVSLPLPDNEPAIAPDAILAPTDSIVLSVGRLDDGKNVSALLRCFAAADQTASWRLVHIGDGPGAAALRQLAVQLQLGDRFKLIGYAGNMQQWYERAQVFASASLFEGFPNVLLEAMACGCACVAYDCRTGPGEIIEHERNGLLVGLGDEAGLTGQLARLLSSAELRTALAAAARQVTRTFSEQAMLDAWLNHITRPGAR